MPAAPATAGPGAPSAPALDPVSLAQALIRCASVTPADAGAQSVLRAVLEPLGFACTDLPFGEGEARIENLYARIGSGAPHFCFAGHTDVVPPGNAPWADDPFAATIRDGRLFGRGACDMKGAIACFAAAAARHLAARGGRPAGSVSLLITGDEEGPAVNGTMRMLDWLAARGEIPDFCLVGEPTNVERLGDMVKIGRRGSMNGTITVHGTQGHVAYPHLADNPVLRLVRMLEALTAEPLDQGTNWFQPSSLQPTTFDVGNPATNVIPARAAARFNIRFNDRHTGESLTRWVRERLDAAGGRYTLDVEVSGEAFLTRPGADVERLSAAIEAVTGIKPRLDTGGGTSDARFIARHCPVAEFGLVGRTMHKADENVPVADLLALTEIYAAVLDAFLPSSGA